METGKMINFPVFSWLLYLRNVSDWEGELKERENGR